VFLAVCSAMILCMLAISFLMVDLCSAINSSCFY
jgi:hypothetical protein